MTTYSLDTNHAALVRAIEKMGFVWVDNAKVKRDEPGQLDGWAGIPNPYGSVGLWIYTEFKTDEGELRPSQVETIRKCKEKGLPVEVIRNTKEIEKMYEKYTAVMLRGLT